MADDPGQYAIVLAPIAAVLASDYFLVKKSRYSVPDLYRTNSIYRYSYGFNWRAAVALAVAIGPCMPGMIRSLNNDIDIGGARYVYCVATIFGLVVGGGMHWLLSTLFPDHESLVAEQILAQDVLDGKVEAWADWAKQRESAASLGSAEKDEFARAEAKDASSV